MMLVLHWNHILSELRGESHALNMVFAALQQTKSDAFKKGVTISVVGNFTDVTVRNWFDTKELTLLPISGMNVTSLYNVSIFEEQVGGNEDDEEKYINDMVNIIGRPILFIFGTAGTYYLRQIGKKVINLT